MSYDIRLGVKVADTDIIAVIAEPEYASPTYNIGTMLRKCMDWDFQQGEWYKVADVLPHIERGIHELRFNRKAYKRYDAPDGWGTTSTALTALESIIQCIDNQGNGWTWQDIPPEHLYLRW